jgi:hypothetical protein
MPSADTDEVLAQWSRVRDEIADAEIVGRIDDVLTRRGVALHDACRATFVLGERSRQWFAERERCVDRQGVILAAVVSRLATEQPRTRAHALMDTIPASDDCDAIVVAESALVRLADAQVRLATGEIAAALVSIDDIATGQDDDASILADSLRARASLALGDGRGAEERWLDVVARARGAGRARLEARSWLALGQLALADGRLARAALAIDFAAAAAAAEPRDDDAREDPLAAEIASTQRELAVARDEPAADAATQ